MCVCVFQKQRISLRETSLKLTCAISVCVRSEVDVYSEI